MQDTSGRPAADAVVDLWSSSTRLARVVTNSNGTFSFGPFIGPARLVVRRIGSRPIERPILTSDAPIVVVLQEGVVSLPAVEIDGGCTSREDRQAREAWRSAAAWYRELPESLWISARAKESVRRISADEAGRPDTDLDGYGWSGYKGLARRWRDLGVAQAGYNPPDPERDQILTDHIIPAESQHFVAHTFGERVRFTVVDERTTRFCPRDRRSPWIEGEFARGEDGSLLWIRWRYGSTHGGWATGGLATFLPPAPDSAGPLLPSSFLIWQERGSGTVVQRSTEFQEWRITDHEPKEWHSSTDSAKAGAP